MATEMNRAELIERLRSMFEGEDNRRFSPFDLIFKFGSPLTALLYSELFWPEFRELNGMVFLSQEVEDAEDEARVRAALAKYGDRTDVEKSFNFVEVPSLFGSPGKETTDEEDMLLARLLAEMWSARLKQLFPERKFEVEVAPATADGDEVGVIFFQRCGSS